MGEDYALLGLERRDGKTLLTLARCAEADAGTAEQSEVSVAAPDGEVWLRCRIERQRNDDGTPRMCCRFSFSRDGRRFEPLGEPFVAQAGRWIGAKVGLVAEAAQQRNDGGWLDVDEFLVTK